MTDPNVRADDDTRYVAITKQQRDDLDGIAAVLLPSMAEIVADYDARGRV